MQGMEMKEGEQELTGKHSAEVSIDAESGNPDEDEDKAQRKHQCALQECRVSFSKTI